MVLGHFHDDELLRIFYFDADLMEDVFRRFADKFDFRPRPLFIGYKLPQAFNRIGIGDFIGPGAFHIDAQIIEDGIDGKDFFFSSYL